MSDTNLRLISWNVNGIRSMLKKGFLEFVAAENPDILCLQETKAEPAQVDMDLPAYNAYWNASISRRGYSGTAIFSKRKPLNVTYGFGIHEHDREGRVITLEFPGVYLVTVYTPNSQEELRRLAYRTGEWDQAFLAHLKSLEATKPVIFCGDLNVAHKEIDIARPKENQRTAGFTNEERANFDRLVEAGFVDTFRVFNQEPNQYSWWSYRTRAREKNIGWRIDYFGASAILRPELRNAGIMQQVMGSDHCPVILEIADTRF